MENKPQVVALYRHPVKGLRPEPLSLARLAAGRGVEGDRAFAFQFLDDAVAAELRAAAAESAPWMSKFNLAMQHDWPGLARLVPSFDATAGELTIERAGGPRVTASVRTAAGREQLARYLQDFLATLTPYEKAKHPQLAPLRLLGHADLSTRYTDGQTGPVTLSTTATFDDLTAKLGTAPLDWRRFRLNIILSGAEAWSELKWMGRRVRIGSAVLEVQKPLGRCANIDVHPDTGARDEILYARLKPTYGHALTGVRGEVVQPGEIKEKDDWELLP